MMMSADKYDSKHIFASNGDYCLYMPQVIFYQTSNLMHKLFDCIELNVLNKLV